MPMRVIMVFMAYSCITLVKSFHLSYSSRIKQATKLSIKSSNSKQSWKNTSLRCQRVKFMSSTSSTTDDDNISTSRLSSSVTPTTTDWYADMNANEKYTSLFATTDVAHESDKQDVFEETINTSIDTVRKPSKKFVSFPFEYHELVDVRIETLTNRGWGLGRVDVSDRDVPPIVEEVKRGRRRHAPKRRADNDDSEDEMEMLVSTPSKWVVMTPNVIPGELIRVRIFRNQRNYSEGDVHEILEPNVEDRVQEPKCPLSLECGGCQYQHMTIQSQRKWKAASVQNSLKQYGIVDVTVSPTMGTDEIYGYRSKLTPHYKEPMKTKDGVKKIESIGFLRQTSRSIIDVPSCLIATPAVNEKYQQARHQLLYYPSSRDRGASLLFRQANLDDPVEKVSTDNNEYITTIINGIKFRYQAGNFFQNNYYVVPHMVNDVVKYASSVPAHGNPMTHLIDCYCGSGLFALSAASKFQTVVGIEVNQAAVNEALQNAYYNQITNCQFLSASAEYIFAEIGHFPRETSVVVLDPPRKGCSVDFLKQLHSFGPQRIVYMSCDPHTQARDASYILNTIGNYRITQVQPFDLFPQTRHIECLIIFERI